MVEFLLTHVLTFSATEARIKDLIVSKIELTTTHVARSLVAPENGHQGCAAAEGRPEGMHVTG